MSYQFNSGVKAGAPAYVSPELGSRSQDAGRAFPLSFSVFIDGELRC
jgi:hypothetical protein